MRTSTVPLSCKDLRRIAAWLALAVGGAMTGPAPCGAGSLRRTPVVEAVQKVQPSVVSITSEKKAASPSRWPFTAEENQRPRVSGMGTGVILDGRGYILTNQHVVDKVQGIEVHLADGSIYPARLVQQDPVMDLAILRVNAGRTLSAISLGTSADLMVGEPVITIGNAFGYENTTSVGIISALKRNVTLSDEQVYRNLIQTDAGINPGNSGGPLVNIDGELIGINVATRAGAQGIGFALPIDDVKRVAAEMLSTRRLAGTWHGLVAGERCDGDARRVLVAEVQPGSPAEAIGVRPGDRVVRVGDLPVTTPLDIERALLDARPGQPVDLILNRQGQEQHLALEVQPLPRSTPDPADQVWRLVGLRITPVTPEYVSAVSPKLRGGLYVQAVSPNSPAARALIQKGDILVGMHVGSRHWETIRPDNILYILKQPEAAQAQAVQYYLVRHNAIQQGALDLADGASTPVTR
jgi:serine protease Do